MTDTKKTTATDIKQLDGHDKKSIVQRIKDMHAPHMVTVTKDARGNVDWSIQCYELDPKKPEQADDFAVIERPCLIKTPVDEVPDTSHIDKVQGKHFIADGQLYIVNNDDQGGLIPTVPMLNTCGLWASTVEYTKQEKELTPWLGGLADTVSPGETAYFIVELGVGVSENNTIFEFIGLYPFRVAIR